jgi:hypothetical protein
MFNFILTCPRRLWQWSGWENPLFFFPLIISKTKTPKLKTSDFNEKRPSTAYSGDMYPLPKNIIRKKFKCAEIIHCNKIDVECTYYVPTTLFVSASIWSTPNSLAIPKSEILGFISLSNNMLLALRSLWIILSLESWWR